MKNQEKQLKSTTIALMVSVALFYDAVTLLLPSVVAPVAALHFWLWFKLNGINFSSPKRLLTGSGTLLAEVFPLTSWLPAWTAAVVIVALDTKAKGTISGSSSSVEKDKAA